MSGRRDDDRDVCSDHRVSGIPGDQIGKAGVSFEEVDVMLGSIRCRKTLKRHGTTPLQPLKRG